MNNKNSFCLLAFEAPNNIQSELSKLKTDIFQETGQVSAKALNGLIPIVFCKDIPEKNKYSYLRLYEAFSYSDYISIEGTFYLGIQTKSLWFEIYNLTSENYSVIEDEDKIPFITYSGFFLLAENAKDLQEKLQNFTIPSFSGVKLKCFTFDIFDDVWWQNYTLTEEWEVPIRKSKQ